MDRLFSFQLVLFSFLLVFIGNDTVFSRETVFVTIEPAKPLTVSKGQTAELTVRAQIKKGFHIQANPAADEFLIPTTLTIETIKGIIPEEPIYPPGIAYRLKGIEEDLLTYEDEVMIKLPVKVLDSAPTGNASLTGKLKYQPCDDRSCFFPRSVPVVIPIEIVQ